MISLPKSHLKDTIVSFLKDNYPKKYTYPKILEEVGLSVSKSCMCKHLQDLINSLQIQRERQVSLQDPREEKVKRLAECSTPFYYSYLPPQQRLLAKMGQPTENSYEYRSEQLDSQRLHRLAVSIHKETM
jgi:hypothetical protein